MMVIMMVAGVGGVGLVWMEDDESVLKFGKEGWEES